MKNGNRGKHYGYFYILLFSVCCLTSTASFAYQIQSRSVMVMDASKGEMLYAKNPYLRRPPASTTKLMTAIVTIENADLADIATISKNASRVAPHKAGFRRGDKVTVENLLYAALLGSANDAAVALAEAVAGSETQFVTLMNTKAIAIGALNTRFTNSSGLPSSGQYTTAYDLAQIMNYALRYKKLKEIIGTRVTKIYMENGNSIFLRNTNKLLWSQGDLLGGKTGYTRKAMHCFVCAAARENETVIVAILGSPGRDDLWRESGTLISKGFEVLGNKAKPDVYFTETYYDTSEIGEASYEKNMKDKASSSKYRKTKRVVSRKTTKHKKA